MEFNFPKGCERERLNRKSWVEGTAFSSPEDRQEKFLGEIRENDFPLRHICHSYHLCPSDMRDICEANIQAMTART